MAVGPNDMIKRNKAAIDALNQAMERLRELRKGTDLEQRKRFNREIARASEEVTELEIINGHLIASTTVIDPIDAETEARLDQLAQRIDNQILNGFKLNATFDTVLDVISFAKEIGGIIDSHEHA